MAYHVKIPPHSSDPNRKQEGSEERERMTKAVIDATVSNVAQYYAQVLEDVRRRYGVTYAQIGSVIGVTERSVFNWISGKSGPRARELAAIMALDSGMLGISVSDLGVVELFARADTSQGDDASPTERSE